MKKYSRNDRVLMAAWAADCAERVLMFFEDKYPDDVRPRRAIDACREWVSTGVFRMAGIRKASLDSHAAARDVKSDSSECFAARAAGQAVATAHVAQHAFGAAYYALKAVAAACPAGAEARVAAEREWQAGHIAGHLRAEFEKRVVVRRKGRKIFITVQKDEDF
ncbi:hypothetical protein KY363_00830 [Candidatus Woesearchaeota archaeon]|nr:hypothetical protein [Candidatus Woesearchaeota archaeon]